MKNINELAKKQVTVPLSVAERARRAVEALSTTEMKWIANTQTHKNTEGYAEFTVWLSRKDGNNVELVGRCPLCGFVQEHGLSSGPYRHPHCSRHLPPFSDDWAKPDTYILRVIAAPLPPGIEVELSTVSQRAGLMDSPARLDRMAYSATMLALKKSANKSKMGRMTKGGFVDFDLAVRALVSSRIFDERIAIMVADGDLRPEVAARIAVAQFIRRQGPGTMLKRLSKACFVAFKRVGLGEISRTSSVTSTRSAS